MKRYIYLINMMLLLSIGTSAQNLVPNGSFEQFVNCPNAYSQVTSNCVGWYQYTSGGSSDYFNTCGINPVGIPANNFGNEAPAHGNAYVGGYTYTGSANYKEYSAATITPMQIGSVYEVSMSVSLSDNSGFATDDLGIYFFDNGPATITGNQVAAVTPQISFTSQGPITTKNGWVRLTANFFADSAYDNIVIGGFLPYSALTLTPVTGGSSNYAYYYIDSVVVKLSSKISINFTTTSLCAGATVNVPYTIQNITFSPGNTFTLQLSDATGSFASPVNIGSINSTAAGNVQGIIPPGTPQGSGYKLRVVSSNPTEISNLTGNITINTIPAGLTTASNSPVCAGGTINLTSSSTTTGVSYSWAGPVAYSAATQNATRTGVTVPMSGYYVVSVSKGGCVVKDSTPVTVNPPLALNATSNAPICTGGTLVLNSTGGGTGTTYNWYGPNSFTANTQNTTIPNVTAAAAGVYMLVGVSGPCRDTTYTTVSLGTPPATPSAGSNTPVCTGNSITLNALSTTPGVTYHWTGPGGYNSNLQNPTRTNATLGMSGTYTVTASIGACPAPAVNTTVVVNPTPGAPTAANNGPLCAGAALDLFATGTTGATYSWNGPSSYSSNAQNPTILTSTTANAGAYTVTQTVNGCTSAAATTNVVINNSVNPALAIFPSPNDTICPGQTVVFVASPNNGGTAPLYQWKKNGNNISGANSATYSTNIISSGDYFSCDMVSTAACAFPQQVQSNNILMTVEPPQPCAVSITANPGLVLSPWELVTFTATPVRGGLLPSYQWLRNGQKVIGAISNTWSANNLNSNDTISVILYSTDPCALPNTDTSSYLVVNIKTGISNVDGSNSITLYPNPNQGDFVIKGNIGLKEAGIEIFNAIGQLVYRQQVAAKNGLLEHTMHLDAATGVYLLKIDTGDGVETIRFRLNH